MKKISRVGYNSQNAGFSIDNTLRHAFLQKSPVSPLYFTSPLPEY